MLIPLAHSIFIKGHGGHRAKGKNLGGPLSGQQISNPAFEFLPPDAAKAAPLPRAACCNLFWGTYASKQIGVASTEIPNLLRASSLDFIPSLLWRNLPRETPSAANANYQRRNADDVVVTSQGAARERSL
jgi:hypothetical protein